MYVPPLQPISNSHFYESGDVIVPEGVAIAPGVILQADPDSRIVLARGVCIGMGAILHARQGTIELAAGVTLGSGVLIVGQAKIGANACIGTGTTIVNADIEPGQVISAASLLGDTGRMVEISSTSATPEDSEEKAIASMETSADNSQETDSHQPTTNPDPTPAAAPPPQEKASVSPDKSPAFAFGQSHLNRLMFTLFPQNQSSFHSSEDTKSSAN